MPRLFGNHAEGRSLRTTTLPITGQNNKSVLTNTSDRTPRHITSPSSSSDSPTTATCRFSPTRKPCFWRPEQTCCGWSMRTTSTLAFSVGTRTEARPAPGGRDASGRRRPGAADLHHSVNIAAKSLGTVTLAHLIARRDLPDATIANWLRRSGKHHSNDRGPLGHDSGDLLTRSRRMSAHLPI